MQGLWSDVKYVFCIPVCCLAEHDSTRQLPGSVILSCHEDATNIKQQSRTIANNIDVSTGICITVLEMPGIPVTGTYLFIYTTWSICQTYRVVQSGYLLVILHHFTYTQNLLLWKIFRTSLSDKTHKIHSEWETYLYFSRSSLHCCSWFCIRPLTFFIHQFKKLSLPWKPNHYIHDTFCISQTDKATFILGSRSDNILHFT